MRYIPDTVSHEDVRALLEYVYREYVKISGALELVAEGRYDPLHVEPTKPSEGQLVYADGTDWDPGAGAGFYQYESAAWVPLKPVGTSGPAGGDLTGTYPNPDIAADAVSNDKLDNMPSLTLKGNDGGFSDNPQDLTVAEVKTMLAYAVADISGLVAALATKLEHPEVMKRVSLRF